MSILILDGQARTGKTTTVQLVRSELIARGYKVDLEKFTKDERSRHHTLIGEILPLAVDDNVIHILDRGIFTELVYAKLYSRPFNADILKLVDELMGRLPVFVAMLVAEPEILIARHNATSRPLEGDVHTISRMFEYEMLSSTIASKTYDTTFELPKSISNEIVGDFLAFLEVYGA